MLGGFPDHTNGLAAKFFARLSPDDRESTQWFLQTGVSPHNAMAHGSDLVKEHAIVDPERKNKDAIKSAHDQLRRMERFLEIFLESKDFYPDLSWDPVLAEIEEEQHEYHETAWANTYTPEQLKRGQDFVTSEVLPRFKHVHAFLDDSKGGQMYFNQERILREFEERKERTA